MCKVSCRLTRILTLVKVCPLVVSECTVPFEHNHLLHLSVLLPLALCRLHNYTPLVTNQGLGSYQ